MLSDKATGRILGAGIVWYNAGELMQKRIALEMGATVERPRLNRSCTSNIG